MKREAFKALRRALAACPLLVCLAVCPLIPAPAGAAPSSADGAARVAEGREPSVLVLPFAVHAAPEHAAQLRQDMPSLLRSSLAETGFRVLPPSGSAGGRAPANDGRARSLASSARADYAVYGTLSQLGDAFSLDMRMVSASGGEAYAYHAERNSLDRKSVV